MEMMIVFVYDTAKCCKEEDDPAEAVMYFHPAWVSLTQRLALAGQLMGVYHFLSTSFSAPRSITLQGGKFVLVKLGQYVLAVGTDRNIQDWILERRADILESLLKFFHCDLVKILDSFNNDRNRFTEKLYQMFETYLPILQYSANLFSNIPVIKLPKSASNIFLEAIQMLQHFQQTNGVLGGALFYNNKIVATQLGADLTKQIVITDPYRIKAPAEKVSTQFHLPVGVQLLQVYIERKQFEKLMQDANNERYYHSYLDTAMKKIPQRKNTVPQKGSSTKEPPVSGASSGMKRDTSRIFTVLEEGEEGEPTNFNDDTATLQYVPLVPATIQDSSPPIRRKQQETKQQERAIKATIPATASSLTPSVCATPLKDVNRVLHDMAMLICSAPEEVENGEEKNESDRGNGNECKTSTSSSNNHDDDDIPDVVKEALRCKRLNKLRNATSKERLMKRKDLDRRSASLPDLTSVDPCSGSSSRICLPELSKTLSKFDQVSPDFKSDSFHRKSHTNESDKRHSRTITDPCFPVFRYDGLPVSQSLYEQYVTARYDCELRDDDGDSGVYMHRKDKLFEEQLWGKLPNDLTNAKSSLTDDGSTTTDAGKVCTPEDGCAYGLNRNQQQQQQQSHNSNRRSMRLPLKPINLTNEEDHWGTCSGSKSCNLTYLRKDGLDGLQLTPLISKLSVLAHEQRCWGPRDNNTPSESRPDPACATFAAIVPAAITPATMCNLTEQQHLTEQQQSQKEEQQQTEQQHPMEQQLPLEQQRQIKQEQHLLEQQHVVKQQQLTGHQHHLIQQLTGQQHLLEQHHLTEQQQLIEQPYLMGQQPQQMTEQESERITSWSNKEESNNDDETNHEHLTGHVDERNSCAQSTTLIQTELFVCGLQNMVLVLLMENGTANNPELIHALWQTCVSTLGKLETRLQQCLEPLPSTDNKEQYSILNVDPQWDTIQRAGLWGITDLDIVSSLHDRFLRSRRQTNGSQYLTELIIRKEDSVIYGNQCGRMEVYYQQTVSPSSFGSLPTPADLMGIVALKAKRRLERDHGIVLL
ncbi:uncharacterized protein LOC116842414 isoform X2 [Odontomachus brunneus]|uniref:uncharacterized protein LOC116842414 isoform X2 n=1 Tax=Odontomachus brunneus TaxID=486640 RepID=UPI0013F2972E|nr:uncharacterized protein LOC116842414 isoform X2 [Odontomachus brunneus]